MHINVQTNDIARQSSGIVVIGTWQKQPLSAELRPLVDANDWEGTFKQTLFVYADPKQFAARRVLLVGLGEQAKWTLDRARIIGANIALKVRELKQTTLSLALPSAPGVDPVHMTTALTEGVLLGAYRFDTFKTLPDERVPSVALETINIYTDKKAKDIQEGVELAEAIAAGVNLTRDLGNNPPMVATPTYLAETAQRIARNYGMQCTIFDHAKQKELGMGGLLGVSKGAKEPAKFIILEHGKAKKDKPTICLVGKGITFDTGGISIKPAENMDKMKMDMQGAGAVLGTMETIGRLKLPIHVVALIASTENMPGSDAYKPGDILKAYNGVTMEILNTDAEGRLVLADALAYAQNYKPNAIIDLATLTGAITVALGSYAAGAMGNNPDLMARVQKAADASGDRVWEMPLWDEYKRQVRSDVADIKNTGGRLGGACTAAAFLSHFVGDYPWVHLDIAGVAWTEDQPKDYNPKGATGFGVRLLTELLREWSASSA